MQKCENIKMTKNWLNKKVSTIDILVIDTTTFELQFIQVKKQK